MADPLDPLYFTHLDHLTADAIVLHLVAIGNDTIKSQMDLSLFMDGISWILEMDKPVFYF